MICGYPITLSNGLDVPCGKCMCCKVNRKRFWTGRLLAEMMFEPQSTFWTLTYAPETVPTVRSGKYAGALTLCPKDLQDGLKRWRAAAPRGERFRYFAVGEYGDIGTERPHYHVAAFGPRIDLSIEDRVNKMWSFVGKDGERQTVGRVTVSPLIPERCAYLAGYTVKKMTSKNDDRLLPGQHPEFTRMSRKPPLGAKLFQSIADTHFGERGSYILSLTGDVQKEFRANNRRYPLGRYWVNKLREYLDVPTPPPLTNEERFPDYEATLAKARGQAQKAYRRELSRPKRSMDSRRRTFSNIPF